MKILKRTFWVVVTIILLYWLGFFILEMTPLCYRSWVHLCGRILTYLVFPLLCILRVAAWLKPLLAGKEIIETVLVSVVGGSYLFWCFMAFLIIMFAHQPEEKLEDNLLVTYKTDFLEERKEVYYRPIAFFFKMPFALDEKAHIEYLEDKYNVSFISAGENLYVNAAYPAVEVSVFIRDGKMEDNYVSAMWAYYFDMWYQEKSLHRKYYVQKNKEGLDEWVYIELKDGKDMEGLAGDVSDLMQYVAGKTDFFEEYYVTLFFYYDIYGWRLTGYLPFGNIEKFGEGAKDYYLQAEEVLDRICAQYENGVESLPKRKEEDKVSLNETTGIEPDEAESDSEQEEMLLEDMAKLIFDEMLAEQDYLFQIAYNAKGVPYIDLGSRAVEEQESENSEEYYRYTLVYDRMSINGMCELFVLYREHYTEDGINDITAILDMYAVEKDSGRVVVANKQSWSDLGTAEYREATGE